MPGLLCAYTCRHYTARGAGPVFSVLPMSGNGTLLGDYGVPAETRPTVRVLLVRDCDQAEQRLRAGFVRCVNALRVRAEKDERPLARALGATVDDTV